MRRVSSRFGGAERAGGTDTVNLLSRKELSKSALRVSRQEERAEVLTRRPLVDCSARPACGGPGAHAGHAYRSNQAGCLAPLVELVGTREGLNPQRHVAY